MAIKAVFWKFFCLFSLSVLFLAPLPATAAYYVVYEPAVCCCDPCASYYYVPQERIVRQHVEVFAGVPEYAWIPDPSY